jgi:hypothetical protein
MLVSCKNRQPADSFENLIYIVIYIPKDIKSIPENISGKLLKPYSCKDKWMTICAANKSTPEICRRWE